MNICMNMTASRPAHDGANGTDSSVNWGEGQVTLPATRRSRR
jgi:hypothetical protein